MATPDKANPAPPPPPPPPYPPDDLPAADDVLAVDPEAALIASQVEDATEPDLSRIPADVLYQLTEAESKLMEEWVDVEATLNAVADRVAGDLNAGHGLAVAVTDQIGGAVLAATDEVLGGLARFVDRAIGGSGKRLSAAADDLRREGLSVPFDPGEWSMLVSESPTEWLPYLVPQIGAALGITGTMPEGVDCTKYPGGVCPPDDTPPPIGWPPVSPPITPGGEGTDPPPPDPGWTCWDGTQVQNLRDCPPRPGYPPPCGQCPVCPPEQPCICPVPPPVDPPGGTCPAPVVQCPAAPDITVNVPPPVVIVNPTPGGGSTSPPYPPKPPVCPDPPPVNVDVSLTTPPPPPPEEVQGSGPVGRVEPVERTPGLNWTIIDGCEQLEAILANPFVDPLPTGGLPGSQSTSFLDGVIRIGSSLISQISPSFKLVTEGLQHVTSAVAAAPTVLVTAAAKTAQDMLAKLSVESVPNPGAAALFGAKLGAANWVEQHTRFPMHYLMQSELYGFQAANPQYIPEQHQCDALFNFSLISEGQWECWTKAHGIIPDHAQLYRDIQVGKPTLDQLIQLRLRKEITENEFYFKAGRIGWSNKTWASDVFKLSVQLPTQTDLLRMMVRDVDDKEVVEKYGYDKDFEKKFAGQLRAWSEAQGIPEEIFRYTWRAHWEIPSNTQLYEMFQRLRPDRPEVFEFNAALQLAPPDVQAQMMQNRPQVVTREDVKYALEVNDKAPSWIDPLLEISYHPITRTDAVRAYQIGSFTRDQLYHSMRDNGYNDRNAETLVKFYEQSTRRSESNATGVLTIRKTVKFFKDGALSRAEAFDALTPLIADPERRNQLLDRAELEIKAELRALKLKGLRKRFVAGEDMPGGWREAISAVTNDAMTTQRILDKWNLEYYGRLREPMARQLCQWYNHNLLSLNDYIVRLLNLGYTLRDAELIAGVCDQDKRAKLAKEIERRLKEQAAEAAKKKKEADKLRERLCHPPKPCWDGSPAP